LKHPQQNKLLAHWFYSEKEWNEFVVIEKANKKEDNIYFGIGIVILGTLGLMFLRSTSFLMALSFSIPLGILIPFLRMTFSYKHLKTGIKNPQVQLFTNYLLINNCKIDLSGKQKRLKSLKIVDAKNNIKLLEFDIQWLTRKGPTNDEFRILIPTEQLEEAKKLVEETTV